MLHLHPQGPRVIPRAEEPDAPSLTFDREHVLKCIKSFKSGSAPGPSGLRAEHIKVAVKKVPRNRTDKALDAVTKLVTVLGAGHLPEGAAPYFAGSRLFWGKKKDGGILPIAVGNITRRLVSKCFSFALADKAAQLLAPFQLGVGFRGGCEAIVHTVRALIEDPNTSPDTCCLLQVDLINAFNRVDRATAFNEVRRLFPELARWFEVTYGTQAELLFGEAVILSCDGFQKGDPLA